MSRKCSKQRTTVRRRPTLEWLEDRLVPATIIVTTFTDVVNPNDKVVSLREAINMANATTGADTIQLQAGVYKLTLTGIDNTNAAGDFDVTNALTIVGKGSGATAIEGTNTDRLFDLIGT